MLPLVEEVEDDIRLAPAPARRRASSAPPLRRSRAGISPENAVFVSLCFEGPDVYSTAGGLGTRVTALTETLADLGYETHLIFVGDPDEPGSERRMDGRLHLVRWCQRISAHYPHGVYDGEEHKLFDFSDSVPRFVMERIVRPATAQGKMVVIIGEDWHTAEAMCRLSDMLHWHGLRRRCILMWNCNSLKSLDRIDWARLSYTTAITTVSRYMKHLLWRHGVNPLVVPNGIPGLYLEPVDPRQVNALRSVVRRGDPDRLFLFKIGRFDPDKRWLMAIEAVARLKASNTPVSLVMRGGMEPHGAEVFARAQQLGLTVRDVEGQPTTAEEFLAALRNTQQADIYNLRFFVPAHLGHLCYAAADAVLANSGHEPFGLVGLEVMASGGVVFTGSTGEDYAVSFENAVALETDDPDEIVGYLQHIQRYPEESAKIREAGIMTASGYVWEAIVENLFGRLAYLLRKQGIELE